MKPRGLSLTLKIFLGTALVVVAIVGATLAITARQASRTVDDSVTRVLASAREAVSAQLTGGGKGLLESATTFAENPQFRSIVEERVGTDVLDQAQEAATSLNAIWVQITDAKGLRIAKSDEPGAPEVDMLGSAEIRSALEDEGTTGFGVTKDTVVIQVAAVPVYGAGKIVGALLVARAIDDAFAAELKQRSASDVEIIFHTTNATGAAVISASTLGRTPEVLAAIEALPETNDASAEMRVERDFAGVHYVGLAEVLNNSAGDLAGGFVMLKNRDAEFAGFKRLQQSLLLSGGLGILVAGLLSLLLARGITRPVSKLAEAARRAADGDYGTTIPQTSGDEIGVLAGAFRNLLGDLKEKQALVDFLSAGDTAKTVQLQAMSATAEQRIEQGGLVPGNRFAGRYEVKEILGEGGMGTVFKAVDGELGEVIAIKTLRTQFLAQDPTALDRFRSEIRLARKISHRNVVRTHDIGENSGVYYITMEFVEGKSLKELIKARRRLPLGVTLSVGKQLARALEVAHDMGVIHRDIKPQNMVVEPDGVLKVMDFGIARMASRKPESGVTQQGMIVGTPEYMAPEQVTGGEVDHRVDIYAAGCVLYECVTGRPPFQAETAYQLIAKLLEEVPVHPAKLNPDVPAALDTLVMAMLSKDPAGRPQTALALHDRLAQIG